MNNKDNNKDNRKTKDLQSLSQTLLPLAQSILGKNGFVETDIITNWPEIVGEQLACYTFPQKIEFAKNKKNNGSLFLSVPSGAFAVEIKHREKYILEKINIYFGYNAVASLKIIQNSNICVERPQQQEIMTTKELFLNEQEKKEIKTLSNDIKNENLKEILIKLGHSIYADNHNVKKKQQ